MATFLTNIFKNSRNRIMAQVFLSYLFSFLIAILVYILFVLSEAPKDSVAPANSLYNTLYIVGLIAVETFVLIVLLKFFKKINLMKIIDVIVTLFAVFGILAFFINSLVWLIVISVAIVILKEVWNNFWFKNFLVFLVVGFFAAYIGYTIGIIPILVLLAIIAIYDYIAVFKTKHMVFLANKIVNNNTLFVMDFGKNVSQMTGLEKVVSNKMKNEKRVEKTTNTKDLNPQNRNHLNLGTGDFALPLMGIMTLFAKNTLFGVLAFIVALFGLELTIWLLFSKKHYALPAIPLQVIALLVIYGAYFLYVLI